MKFQKLESNNQSLIEEMTNLNKCLNLISKATQEHSQQQNEISQNVNQNTLNQTSFILLLLQQFQSQISQTILQTSSQIQSLIQQVNLFSLCPFFFFLKLGIYLPKSFFKRQANGILQ